jgi:predicted dehydrogenase
LFSATALPLSPLQEADRAKKCHAEKTALTVALETTGSHRASSCAKLTPFKSISPGGDLMPHDNIRVLCVGTGHMGRSHAIAYDRMDGFEIAGICTRTASSRAGLLEELSTSCDVFDHFHQALSATHPDAVAISTYPDTHYEYAKTAIEAGCHVFLEKPIAVTVQQAKEVVDLAIANDRKLVVGYILRHHPSWQKFISVARTLGKPLVMRMNLNQQSSGENWETHKQLMASISPIVDCGVHYVDVMCQMTSASPIRVAGMGARLTDELPEGKINYGHLQVTFDDGSVGWYEAGWGPMMSEVAFFLKDVVGPKGCVSIVAEKSASEGQSANVAVHTQTQALRVHYAQRNSDGTFAQPDEVIRLDDEPDHDELCRREQAYFLRAIRENLDLTQHLQDALNSMRIVAAADASYRTGKMMTLGSE